MDERTIRFVLRYDGTHFSGWQRQAAARTVQATVGATLILIAFWSK